MKLNGMLAEINKQVSADGVIHSLEHNVHEN